MSLKITLFITMLVYTVIISQCFFYMVAMSRVMRSMQLATYIESRQLLDKNLRPTLSFVYYFALIACIALTAFCVTNPSGFLFASSVIALIALVADLILTVKGSLPLNKVINSWTEKDHPHNWKTYRNQWLTVYSMRQVANVIGFTSLLAGIIFGL